MSQLADCITAVPAASLEKTLEQCRTESRAFLTSATRCVHGFQAAVSTVESVAKAVPSLFAACLDQMGASVIPRFDMIEIGLKETEEMDIKTARMRSLSPDFAGITGKLLEHERRDLAQLERPLEDGRQPQFEEAPPAASWAKFLGVQVARRTVQEVDTTLAAITRESCLLVEDMRYAASSLPFPSLKVLMVKEGLRPTAALAAPVFSSQGKPIGVVTLVFINPEAVFSFDQADPVAALPFSYRREFMLTCAHFASDLVRALHTVMLREDMRARQAEKFQKELQNAAAPKGTALHGTAAAAAAHQRKAPGASGVCHSCWRFYAALNKPPRTPFGQPVPLWFEGRQPLRPKPVIQYVVSETLTALRVSILLHRGSLQNASCLADKSAPVDAIQALEDFVWSCESLLRTHGLHAAFHSSSAIVALSGLRHGKGTSAPVRALQAAVALLRSASRFYLPDSSRLPLRISLHVGHGYRAVLAPPASGCESGGGDVAVSLGDEAGVLDGVEEAQQTVQRESLDSSEGAAGSMGPEIRSRPENRTSGESDTAQDPAGPLPRRISFADEVSSVGWDTFAGTQRAPRGSRGRPSDGAAGGMAAVQEERAGGGPGTEAGHAAGHAAERRRMNADAFVEGTNAWRAHSGDGGWDAGDEGSQGIVGEDPGRFELDLLLGDLLSDLDNMEGWAPADAILVSAPALSAIMQDELGRGAVQAEGLQEVKLGRLAIPWRAPIDLHCLVHEAALQPRWAATRITSMTAATAAPKASPASLLETEDLPTHPLLDLAERARPGNTRLPRDPLPAVAAAPISRLASVGAVRMSAPSDAAPGVALRVAAVGKTGAPAAGTTNINGDALAASSLLTSTSDASVEALRGRRRSLAGVPAPANAATLAPAEAPPAESVFAQAMKSDVHRRASLESQHNRRRSMESAAHAAPSSMSGWRRVAQLPSIMGARGSPA